MNETPDAIQQAADDPWFDVQDGLVAIAVHETGHAESRGEKVRTAEEASSQILRSGFSSGDPTSER